MAEISKTKQRTVGIILSYGSLALNAVTGILYTPVMLRLMGQNEYGLYGTVLSFVSLLSLLDVGFSSSYIKFYSKFKKEGRQDKIESFNAIFFTVFLIISVIAFIIGMYFSFHLDYVFDKGLTTDEFAKARIMMILLTISTAIGFSTTIFNCCIGANEKFILSKGLSLTSTILTVLVNLVVLYYGCGAIGLIVVSLVLTIIVKIIYIYVSFVKLKLRFNFKAMDKSLFKQILAFSGLIAINMVVDKVNTGIDSVLLGRFCGTAVVAVYSIGASLNSHFTSFSTAVFGVFIPKIHDIVNSYEMDSPEQRKAITAFFVKVGRLQYMILALVLSGFIFFGKPFIRIWAGEGYDDAYIIALVMMAPSIIPLSQNVGIEIQRAFNRHHYRAYIYGIMAIFNLVASIFLCQILGGIGSAIGTGAACIIANIIIMNIVYDKKININIIDYWKNIGKMTLGMIIPFIVGVLMMIFVDLSSIPVLVICILAYSLVYVAALWIFVMNDYEKGFAVKVLRKFKIVKR